MRKVLSSFIALLLIATVFAQTGQERRIIFKIKADYSHKCYKSSIAIPELSKALNGCIALKRKFPHHTNTKGNNNDAIDLSNIYEVIPNPNISINKQLAQLKNIEAIVYAELKVENKLVFDPNDSLRGQQYYLNAIKAFQAWDINQGDTSIIIGMVDTGTDLDHPDLVNNQVINYSDPINGIDDDNDGYIDNYYGWNTASNNNDVSFYWGVQASSHGTNVAGIACAEVNNSFGIAGVAYKTRFLTIKNQLPSGFLNNSYEGIVYAADHGADIINCSWGSSSYSLYAQDVINYATFNKGSLVVAATGNNGHENKFYPAAYENVLSVGSTLEGDTVKATSNFGTWVKIMAPGDNILTCNVIGGFGTNGGTSMAAPIVSACAAVVKSHFPNYNTQQIAQQLITTADNIDNLAPSNYAGKLGSGRVNLLRALTETNSPGIELVNYRLNSDLLGIGDTIKLSGDFVNYLNPSSPNAKARISISNGSFSVLKNEIQLGVINTMDTLKSDAIPFLIQISGNTDFNSKIEIELTIEDGNYSAKQIIELVVNKDYITLTENELTATYSSAGAIGFSGSSNELGEGISFQGGTTLLYEGSFAVGNADIYLLDKFRDNNNGTNNDFKVVSRIQKITPEKANVELKATFNDANFSNPQGLEIIQWNYLFRSGNGANSIIYVYSLRNNGFIELRNLYAGLFMDWDISTASKNKIFFDSTRSMGVSYATDTSLYCGITKLTNSLTTRHYAIDNIPGSDGIIDAFDGLTNQEKIDALSNRRDSAGNGSIEGNDIIDVISAGPFNLKIDSSISIAFAITISDSLTKLRNESDSVKLIFERLALGIVDHQNSISSKESVSLYPNPTQNNLNLRFYLAKAELINLQVFDIKGHLVFNLNSKLYSKGINELEINTRNLKSGLYLIRLFGNNLNIETKFIVSGK